MEVRQEYHMTCMSFLSQLGTLKLVICFLVDLSLVPRPHLAPPHEERSGHKTMVIFGGQDQLDMPICKLFNFEIIMYTHVLALHK